MAFPIPSPHYEIPRRRSSDPPRSGRCGSFIAAIHRSPRTSSVANAKGQAGGRHRRLVDRHRFQGSVELVQRERPFGCRGGGSSMTGAPSRSSHARARVSRCGSIRHPGRVPSIAPLRRGVRPVLGVRPLPPGLTWARLAGAGAAVQAIRAPLPRSAGDSPFCGNGTCSAARREAAARRPP